MGSTTALALALAILLADAAWVARAPAQAQLVTGPLAAGLLLIVGRAAGLSWSQLGLGGGLPRWSLAAVAAVAAGYAVLLRLPRGRRLLRDERYHLGRKQALFHAVVEVPLATVLPEEVAFRGVLWALLAARDDAATATVVTAALFGVWHVPPALVAARGRRQPGVVWGTVAATAAAGLLLGWLRQLSGGLAVPALLHWVVNGLGVLAAARAWTAEPPPNRT